MRRMFASATLKLTAWYLIILVTICLIFSFIIFELSTSEISRRLERLQIRAEGSTQTLTLPGPLTLSEIRANQTEEARASIFIGLLYMNLAVVGLGGVGSYLLARRTLLPIEQAHEAQSRFTSDASHELRTPLAIMKSEIQVAMRDSSMKSKDYRELLMSNLEEVDKLTLLSQSLLELSRLDYVDIQRIDKVHVRTAILAAAKSLKLTEERLNIQQPARAVIIDGNQAMITELFKILLDNANKYSPKNTMIHVQIRTNGRNCQLVVSNEGKGIHPSEHEKIFERFYRSERSRSSSRGVSGYGLGLALAQKIVSAHEGSIAVSSSLGATTSFTVSLPQITKKR